MAINNCMGVKISELTAANKLVGNELYPVIQSTETRQTAVSSVFSALTSQTDSRYCYTFSCDSQGQLGFTSALNSGSINLGLLSCDSPTFSSLTISDSLTVDTNTFYVDSVNNRVGVKTTSPNQPLTVIGSISGTNNLASGSNAITNSSTCTLITGHKNEVGSNCSSVVGGCNNKVYSSSTRSSIIGGDSNAICTGSSTIVGGQSNTVCSGSNSTIIGGICNTTCHACSVVAGSGITTKATNTLHANCLYLQSVPSSDPGIAGMVYRDACGNLKISL